MSQFTGATKRSSKRACAWKRKATGLAPLQRFTGFWKMRRAPIGEVNCFGIIKRDSMQPGCWKTIQNGNLLLLSTRNWPDPTVTGAKKQGRVFVLKLLRIGLHKIRNGITIQA